MIDYKDNIVNKSKASLWPHAVVLFIASVLFTGYRVYFHNQSLQIPLIYLLNDRSLYPNDPFAATLPYYASLVWHIAALMARVTPLEHVLLGLFLIERFMVIYAAGRAAQALVPESKLAPVGAMILLALAPEPIIGGGTIVMSYFEQTGLAMAFFLFATAAFYERRPLAWALWMAAGFNANSMYGTYALTYFGAAFLLDQQYKGEWKSWIKSLVVFSLFIIPTVMLTLSAYDKASNHRELWLAAAYIRLPHHLFPMARPFIDYIMFSVMMIATLIALRAGRSESDKICKHGMIWSGVALLWLVYAFAAEWLKSPSLLVMQPSRGMDPWYCFASIAVISVWAKKIESDASSILKAGYAAVVIVCGVLLWQSHRLPIVTKISVLTVEWLVLWVVSLGKDGAIRSARFMVAAVCVAGVILFSCRIHNRGSIVSALVRRPKISQREIAHWARFHTQKSSQFLISPSWGEFRSLSKRPVFVTWKDGSALLWYRPFVTDWVERLQGIGYDITRAKPSGEEIFSKLDRIFEHLTDKDVLKLRSRYQIDYWVVRPEHRSSFPIAFKGKYYKVLAIPCTSL